MRPTRLVLWGFILVGVSPLAFLRYESASPGDETFYVLTTAVGFAILGYAARAWLAALQARPAHLAGLRPVLRGFALAYLVLGVAYLGLINEVIAVRRRFHTSLRWEELSYVLSLLGFAVAAWGFWGAARLGGSNDVKAPEPGSAMADGGFGHLGH